VTTLLSDYAFNTPLGKYEAKFVKVKPNVSLVKKMISFLKNKLNNLNFIKNPCLPLFLLEDVKIVSLQG
jgi:hypothetical protein